MPANARVPGINGDNRAIKNGVMVRTGHPGLLRPQDTGENRGIQFAALRGRIAGSCAISFFGGNGHSRENKWCVPRLIKSSGRSPRFYGNPSGNSLTCVLLVLPGDWGLKPLIAA